MATVAGAAIKQSRAAGARERLVCVDRRRRERYAAGDRLLRCC